MSQASASIPSVPLFIQGEWQESRSTEWREVINPATQEVLARDLQKRFGYVRSPEAASKSL